MPKCIRLQNAIECQWLFVVIYLQIDIFIKDDVCVGMCTVAKQLDYVYCAG